MTGRVVRGTIIYKPMRRADMKTPIRLTEASQIFLAMHGDKQSQEGLTLADVTRHIPAETFEDFLDVNQLKPYDFIPR